MSNTFLFLMMFTALGFAGILITQEGRINKRYQAKRAYKGKATQAPRNS